MQKENPTIAAFKVWVFPSLVSIVSIMIWNDVNEIKADVKALIAQSNQDKIRIDNLERQVYGKPTSLPLGSDDKKQPALFEMYAVLPNTEPKIKKKIPNL
jgi:hypothetical protein